MRNIKFIYILILLCFCIKSSASNVDSPNVAKRDSLVNNNIDPLYMQLYGGINKSANENLPYSEFTRYPFSFGAFLGMGKEITPLWGWRTAFGINHNKSRNVMKCESSDTWGWNDIELFGDVTFDITDVIKNETSNSKFNLKTFAGIGGLWTYSFPKNVPLSYTYPYSRDSELLFGFRAGLTATWKISDCMRVGMELSHTMVLDKFNGVVDKRSPLDNRTNLSVGFSWNLKNKKQQKQREPIVYANRLRDIPELQLIIPEREVNKKRQLEGIAYLDFPVNEIKIYPSYRNNPHELQKIKQSIDDVRFDSSVVITSITLHGYASPESPYNNNERLAKGRTSALVNYLKKEYKLNDTKFITHYTPEDWGNLRLFISDSMSVRVPNMSEYCSELLDIIDKELDPDIKEDKLKAVGKGTPYKWLYENVYPALRHTDYLVDYTLKEYPVKDARRLIYTHPEALSLEEMYNVALYYPEEDEGYYDALMIAANQYSDNVIANYNAACISIKRRKLKDAKRFASKAGNSDDTLYLINLIKAMEGSVNWHFENNKLIIDGENK